MEEQKSKLQALRLSGMAGCLQTLYETRKMHELSLIDGLQMLIQAESDVRWNNRYSRLLKSANFRYTASLEQIDTGGHRGIDPGMLSTLAVGNYIKNGESILITGATGVGKSMLATALGHQACRQGYSVMYYNTQKLLPALKVARLEGILMKRLEKLAKADLLILDDFGLTTLDGQQQNDIMEIIEDRHARKSTIIVSQLPVAAWFDIFPEQTIADAILDRIVHTAHRFTIKGESLRKKR
jgi:DNA replication protein DnaC